MAFEYITYPGNGDLVQTVFNAVATLSGSSTLEGAARAASLFGFLVMLTVAAYKLDLRDTFVTILSIGFVWTGLMGTKTDLTITETAGSGYSGRQYAVSNVPFGLAAIASFISQLGTGLTTKMEQVNTLPNDLNYSRTGMVFGAQLYEDLQAAKFTDQTLVKDWALFMHNCSFFDLNMYHKYTLDELRYSPDTLAVLGKTNSNLFTNITDTVSADKGVIRYGPGSETKICTEAFQELKKRTEYHINTNAVVRVANNISKRVGVAPGHWGNLSGQTAVLQLSDTSFQYLLSNARFDTLKNIEQAAMVDLIRQTGYINQQRIKNYAAIQRSFALAQAKSQYITSQKTGALMASWNLPMIRSIVEAILIGLFPIVIVLALLAGVGALRMLMFYVSGLLWLQLWAPVASIMNLMLTVYAKRVMTAEASLGGGMITPGTGDTLLRASADIQAVAGGAMWLIPFIAAALVMGGRTIFNSVMGMATGAKAPAESAGAAAGAGNFNAGNMSYNNESANKSLRNALYSDPGVATSTSLTGTRQADMATGNQRYQINASNLGVSQTGNLSQASSASRQATVGTSVSSSTTASLTDSISSNATHTLGIASQYFHNSGISEASSWGVSNQTASNLNQVWTAAQRLSESLGAGKDSSVTREIAGSLGASLDGSYELFNGSRRQAGGNAGQNGTEQSEDSKNPDNSSWADKLVAKLQGQVGVNGKYSAQNVDRFKQDLNQAREALASQGISFSQSDSENIASSQGYTAAAGSSKTVTDGDSAQLSLGKSATLTRADSRADMMSSNKTATDSVSASSSVTVNNTEAVAQAALNNRSSMEEIAQNPQDFAKQFVQSGGAGSTWSNDKYQADSKKLVDSLTPSSRVRDDSVEARHAANSGEVRNHHQGHESAIQDAAHDSGNDPGTINHAVDSRKNSLGNQLSAAQAGFGTEHQNVGRSIDQNVSAIGQQAEAMRKNNSGTIGAGILRFEDGSAAQKAGSGKFFSSISLKTPTTPKKDPPRGR